MPNKFYLTTPIYYVNARPHIGHAYTTLAADVIARRHRLLGDDTFLLTGTDEHGQKIERSAAAAGIPPQQFADEVSASFQSLWRRMGITNDAFIRTTSDAHKRGAQKLFADLHARSQIYLSSYTGQYSVGEEMFIDGPPGTLGPDGKPTETVTEENFFFKLSAYQDQLIKLIENDEFVISPESRKNEVLSFLYGDYSDIVQEYNSLSPDDPELISSSYNSSEEPDIAPAGKTNIPAIQWGLAQGTIGIGKKGYYRKGALRDLSVSRSSFTWGIPVPEPAASETQQKHVIYVWLDALANYMTALGYGSDEKPLFDKFWPADLHLVGKEIIRFHCVYWPAFLLALKPAEVDEKDWVKKMLPKAVTAHGWLLFDDAKMSKSKGNIVRTETILDAFGEHVYKKQFPDSTKEEQDLFATDVLRYFLLREIPFGQDGSFSFDSLWNRYNSDLTNGYGNLVSRTLTMIYSYFSGIVPDPPGGFSGPPLLDSVEMYAAGSLLKGTNDIRMLALEHCHVYAEFLESYSFSVAISAPFSSVAWIDGYISDHEPWKLAKQTDAASRQKLSEILYTAAESIRIITALLYPIFPNAATKVWQQLGLGDIELAAKNGELANLQWGGLEPGTKLGPLSPIFPRAPKELAQIMIDMEAAKASPHKEAKPTLTDEAVPAAPEPHDTNHPGAGPRTAAFTETPPGTPVAGSHAVTTERVHTPHTEAAPSGIFAADIATPQIGIDDFIKVDLRVAQVLVAERIPKADKLLRLEVDLGYERRQILSGIAEWYTPEELIGRRIVIVANLAPRKMRGFESHGMLLAASSGDTTKPILTTFGEDIALGSRVR